MGGGTSAAQERRLHREVQREPLLAHSSARADRRAACVEQGATSAKYQQLHGFPLSLIFPRGVGPRVSNGRFRVVEPDGEAASDERAEWREGWPLVPRVRSAVCGARGRAWARQRILHSGGIADLRSFS